LPIATLGIIVKTAPAAVVAFKKLLLDVCLLTPEEQKASIERSFYEWKGECDQVDDILVFGMKI